MGTPLLGLQAQSKKEGFGNKMERAKIVEGKPSGKSFGTTTKNTSLSQRETLERIMVNLATHVGITKINRLISARGAVFYEPQGLGESYQSASNTILTISELILKKHASPET